MGNPRHPGGTAAAATVQTSHAASRVRRAGVWLGPALALAVHHVLPRFPTEDATSGPATAAVAVWMAVWWLTEPLPIYATALIPLAAFPLFGIAPIREAAAPYAHELIFLFMGGFMLALAMQRTGLHKRFTLTTLRLVGDEPRRMIGGFMGVAAGLSMWVSNTATVVMMLPVAVSVLEIADDHAPAGWNATHRRHFGLALLLGIAYGASIGGVATPVGTPPNLFLLSFMDSELGHPISFAQWMAIGVPLVAVMLPASGWLLVHRLFPVPKGPLEGGRGVFIDELRALGPIRRAEGIVLFVFASVSLLWLTRPLLVGLSVGTWTPFAGASDAGIAILGALVLFCVPDGEGGRVLDWPTAERLPWGVLILFGGGLSLASAIGRNGVADWIGQQSAGLAGLPAPVIVLGLVASMVFLTELTSNTASTAALVPVLAAAAPGLGVSPELLVVPVAIAASFAFMLPVATPPNAVVFSSGRIEVRDMMRAGLALNFLGIVVVGSLTFLVIRPLLVP